MQGIVGIVFFAGEVYKVCTPMHVKFFHDLVLELAGSKGGALDSGSRRRCFRLETAERRHGIIGSVGRGDGEGVGSSDRG